MNNKGYKIPGLSSSSSFIIRDYGEIDFGEKKQLTN